MLSQLQEIIISVTMITRNFHGFCCNRVRRYCSSCILAITSDEPQITTNNHEFCHNCKINLDVAAMAKAVRRVIRAEIILGDDRRLRDDLESMFPLLCNITGFTGIVTIAV